MFVMIRVISVLMLLLSIGNTLKIYTFINVSLPPSAYAISNRV
jgi:hypothetical protein